MGSRTVCLAFLVVAVACGALAIHYRRLLHDEIEKNSLAGKRTASNSATQDPAAAFEQKEAMSRKDAEIAKLRKQVSDLKSGGATRGSTAGRSDFLARQRERRTEEDEAAAAEEAQATEDTRMYGSTAKYVKFFSDADVSLMEPGQYEQHTKMVKGLTEIEELLGQVRSAQTPDEAAPLEAEITRRVREIQPFLAAERDILLYTTGRQLGYDYETSRWFLDYLKQVSEFTNPEILTRAIWQGPR